jgi:geranylgeranyl diphosphate synthase type II
VAGPVRLATVAGQVMSDRHVGNPGLQRMPPASVRPALQAAVAVVLPPGAPEPDRVTLERWGRAALAHTGLDEAFLGYAMVLASNAWWMPAFAAVPHHRRLLLLPHCLRLSSACLAPTDVQGLHCAGCGGCDIGPLQAEAEGLGWRVLVAEGTAAVTEELVAQGRDAVLGVACLDSLDRSFQRARELGIPHLAIPLDQDGCSDTTVEGGALRALMRQRSAGVAPTYHTWLPLLREAAWLCDAEPLARLLGPLAGGASDPVSGPAVAWLRHGGKRLRAFISLAAYAVGRHGVDALRPDADIGALLGDGARRVALAIEVLHKASLVHDDIEDDEATRYGQPTLHQSHGIPAAVNLGDHLIGLGYRLVAAAAPEVGAEASLAILTRLADAHLALCRGQGAELAHRASGGQVTPLEALALAAGKTGPAFAAALGSGLLAAGATVDAAALDAFARCLGEAFQVMDDLDDWTGDGAAAGEDVRVGQPTILRAFALERCDAAELAARPGESTAALVERVRGIYAGSGAFGRAERLGLRLRQRAAEAASELSPPAIAELGGFLVRVILVSSRP